MRIQNLKILFLALFLTGLITEAQAAVVTAVKNQRAVISFEDDLISEGDEFFLINPATGKRTAIIRIRQTKGSRALADIIKGKANAGFTLEARAYGRPPISADVTEEKTAIAPDLSFQRTLKDSFGLLVSTQSHTMNAEISYKDNFNLNKKTSVSMSGNGLGIGGFYDYAFADAFVGRAYGAYEQFNVAGGATEDACNGGKDCNANINFLSLYGLVKWYPLQGKYRPWIGGGLGFMMAMSKSSSALNESQISTNQVYTLGGGLDIQLNRFNYIPLSIEMNQFPSSASVSASSMILKAGWAWNL